MENLNDAVAILDTLSKVSVSISDNRTFTIRSEKIGEIKELLASKNIIIDELLANDEIKLTSTFYDSNNILVYSSFDCFLRLFKFEDVASKTLIILGNNNDEPVLCKEKDGIFTAYTYFSGVNYHKASNFFYLKKITTAFLPQIADYEDSPNSTFIFLSSECGRLDIVINNLLALVESEESFKDLFSNISDTPALKDYSELPKLKEHFKIMLKNRIIRGLDHTLPEERFVELTKKLKQIVEGANRDFELFSSSFKHEDILKQFESEKYQFADKIRSMLERISTNILSVPISIIIALFALRDISILWLTVAFFIALGLFVIFTTIMNILFYKDLSILREEMNFKYDFLTKGAKTLQKEFKKQLKPFENRIIFLQCLIKTTIIIFIVLYFIFLYWYLKNSLVLHINPIIICHLLFS